MFEWICVVLLCILLIFGIGDVFFNALKFGLKLFLGIVLVLGGIYFIVKAFFVLVPWVLLVSILAFIVGIVLLLKVIF